METTVKNSKQTVPTPAVAWEKTEAADDVYSADDVLNAYLSGKRDGFAHGVNDMQRMAVKALRSNAEKAAALTRTTITYLQEHGIATAGAYLRVSSWDDLSVMVLVNSDDFLKPEFKQVYYVVGDMEDASEQEDLALDFSFAPHAEGFNIACLNTDGYALRLLQQAATA